MNQIILKGRLTRDPEMKTTDYGKTVTTASIAVDRRYKDSNGDKLTDFFNLTAWEKTGEFIAKYFSKGQEILVTGSMQSRSYEGRDGAKRTAWDVHVDAVEFCGTKGERSAVPSNGPSEAVSDLSDEELPF